jgi:hypothetical protein
MRRKVKQQKRTHALPATATPYLPNPAPWPALPATSATTSYHNLQCDLNIFAASGMPLSVRPRWRSPSALSRIPLTTLGVPMTTSNRRAFDFRETSYHSTFQMPGDCQVFFSTPLPGTFPPADRAELPQVSIMDPLRPPSIEPPRSHSRWGSKRYWDHRSTVPFIPAQWERTRAKAHFFTCRRT